MKRTVQLIDGIPRSLIAFAAGYGVFIGIARDSVSVGVITGLVLTGVIYSFVLTGVIYSFVSLVSVIFDALLRILRFLMNRGSPSIGHINVHAATARDATGLIGVTWQAMRLAAWLMPPAAGRRWLAEASNFLAEAPAALQRGAIHSYLANAPQVIAVSWAMEAASRIRVTGDGPR